MKILLLEDDKLFNETLEDFLEEEGFELCTALDPYTALDLAYEHKFDLYLFDVNLPYESGFDLLEKLRDAGDMTPTIFLTSRDDKNFLIEGFSRGADDYMIDCNAKELYHENRQVTLTSKAIDLLLLLLIAKGEVVTLEEIESNLWHTNEEASLGAIRVYVTSLKKYFPLAIQNIRGIGYRFTQSEV